MYHYLFNPCSSPNDSTILVPVLNQINPVRFNVTFPSMITSPKSIFPLIFPKNIASISDFFHICYTFHTEFSFFVTPISKYLMQLHTVMIFVTHISTYSWSFLSLCLQMSFLAPYLTSISIPVMQLINYQRK